MGAYRLDGHDLVVFLRPLHHRPERFHKQLERFLGLGRGAIGKHSGFEGVGFRTDDLGPDQLAKAQVRFINLLGLGPFFLVGVGQIQVAPQHSAFHFMRGKRAFHLRRQFVCQQPRRVLHGKAVNGLAHRQMRAGKALGLRKAQPLRQRARRGVMQPNPDIHASASFLSAACGRGFIHAK